MESDLHPKSVVNLLLKYADDTNLLVPEKTDVELADEFRHIASSHEYGKKKHGTISVNHAVGR